MQYLIFKLNDELYGINTSVVQSINEMLPISNVPMAEKYIKGMVNLRGIIKLILDTNKLLNEEDSKVDQKRIIFLRPINNEDFGLMVDDVFEILDVEENQVQKIEGHIKYYVDGVIKTSENMIIAVDFEKIIEKIRNEG